MPKHPGTGHSVYFPTGDRRCDVTGSLPKWLKKGERRAEPRTAFVTPAVNALSFWEDNWLSLVESPTLQALVAWQPKLISKDEVQRIAASIAKLPELLLR